MKGLDVVPRLFKAIALPWYPFDMRSRRFQWTIPMPWNERALVEYEFYYGAANQRKAVARLGFPERDDAYDDEWVCSFQIEGLKDSKVRRARGMDGLQALTIASMAVRSSLDRLKTIKVDREPYQAVFPRYLPFCYGVEFHQKLCEMVDKCTTLKKRRISRRRRQRSSRS